MQRETGFSPSRHRLLATAMGDLQGRGRGRRVSHDAGGQAEKEAKSAKAAEIAQKIHVQVPHTPRPWRPMRLRVAEDVEVPRPPRPWRPMRLRVAEDVEVPRPPRAALSPAPSPAKSRLPPQYANLPLKPRVPGPAARACPGRAGFGGARRRRPLSSRPSRHQAPPRFHSVSRRIFTVAAAAWLATKGRPAYRDARLAAAAGIPAGSESAVPRRQSDRRKKERDDAIAELNALRAARPPLAGARTRQSRPVPAPPPPRPPAPPPRATCLRGSCTGPPPRSVSESDIRVSG